MRDNKPVYYWDTCIFIAWIKNEQLPNAEMNGVFEIADKIQSNRAILITSQLLTVELLPCKMPPHAMDLIERFFKRKNAQKKAVDGRVTQLAQKIRNEHPKVSPNDAIHLATAIHYEVDQFHTFDDGGKDGSSILSLNGRIGDPPLVICKPPFTQYRLSGI